MTPDTRQNRLCPNRIRSFNCGYVPQGSLASIAKDRFHLVPLGLNTNYHIEQYRYVQLRQKRNKDYPIEQKQSPRPMDLYTSDRTTTKHKLLQVPAIQHGQVQHQCTPTTYRLDHEGLGRLLVIKNRWKILSRNGWKYKDFGNFGKFWEILGVYSWILHDRSISRMSVSPYPVTEPLSPQVPSETVIYTGTSRALLAEFEGLCSFSVWVVLPILL